MPHRRFRNVMPFALLALLLATLAVPMPQPVAAQATGTATINLTFVSCPPGGTWEGPPQGCQQIVDAPEFAVLTGPDWVQNVQDLPRDANGSYTATSVPADAGEIGLVNFFSPNHNAFTFEGADVITRWYGGVSPTQGEVRDITVFYWNGPVDLIMPAENNLTVNVVTCDEGIDPNADASACEPMTADIPGLFIGTPPQRGIDMADYLTRDGGAFRYTGLPAYTQAEVIADPQAAGFGNVLITGWTDGGTDTSATAFMLRAENRVIDVAFYNPVAGSDTTWTLTPAETPEAGTGTVRLLMLQCPEGVVPHDDPSQCTEALVAGPDVGVTFEGTGERVLLGEFERDTAGAYLVTGVEGFITIDGIAPGQGRRLATDADAINGDVIVYRVEPGETRDGRLYYYTTE
jgi:hypothetical protein